MEKKYSKLPWFWFFFLSHLLLSIIRDVRLANGSVVSLTKFFLIFLYSFIKLGEIER